MRQTGMPAAEAIDGTSGGTITTIPTPMLKVRHISSRWTPPACWMAVKIGGTVQRGALDGRGEPFREHARHVVDHAAAGDVRHGADRR